MAPKARVHIQLGSPLLLHSACPDMAEETLFPIVELTVVAWYPHGP